MATIRCSRGSRVRLEYGFEQHQGEIDVAGRSPAQLSPIANGRASGDNDWDETRDCNYACCCYLMAQNGLRVHLV